MQATDDQLSIAAIQLLSRGTPVLRGRSEAICGAPVCWVTNGTHV